MHEAGASRRHYAQSRHQANRGGPCDHRKLPRSQRSDISAAPQLFRHDLGQFVEQRQDEIARRLWVAVDLRPRKIEPEVFEPVPVVIYERSRERLQDSRTVVRIACCFEQDSAMLQLAFGSRAGTARRARSSVQ
jgi:hypothetical protein